jgi:hypothetical protein
MHYQTRLVTRRVVKLLVTSSLLLALGSAVTGCAKEATRATGTGELGTVGSSDAPNSAAPSTEPTAPATVTSPGVVTQTTLPRPDEFQVLVTMLETGGMCAGPCGDVQTTIYSDGTWSYGAAPSPTDRTVTATTLPPMQGQLDDALTQQLKTALAKTTAAELQALPTTQQYCPSAADGRDLSFTYSLQGTAVTVSNCTVDLLEANELLRLTSLAREDIAIMANQKG